jgi:hypothetical protein
MDKERKEQREGGRKGDLAASRTRTKPRIGPLKKY